MSDRKFNLVLNVGQPVNLLGLTQNDPESDRTDCLADLQIEGAERLSSGTPREVDYRLPDGSVFHANNETGKVSWENASEGLVNVEFNRINMNRRPLEHNRQTA